MKVGDVISIPSKFLINPEPVNVDVIVTALVQESDDVVTLHYEPATDADRVKIEQLLQEQRGH